ncbi:hypothetical protein MNEG_15049 [Monoraphidium neglectum]|uniref:Uncharacterized protein n=1 Tax=Monoraphidium neglectum TaxID=145388 RepID=A0A0D2MCB5_9CHLO|nr:hypothetical protein MNEG_15049 [Monoraphidium neglectum]KIY92915.1 hypothetical protein MNEG_15049 [Monoraphidium neglectum]|eukprot:XP_013891935.1 hypothetical protein MNEG_15049 [Monoraphidium neglectum]
MAASMMRAQTMPSCSGRQAAAKPAVPASMRFAKSAMRAQTSRSASRSVKVFAAAAVAENKAAAKAIEGACGGSHQQATA